MKLALKVRVNGQTEIMDISGDTLSSLQSAVGGYVECVSMKWEVDAWLDEEGKLKNYKINQFASMLLWETYELSETNEFFDYIVGDVVLTGKSDEDGEITPLSDVQIDNWVEMAAGYRRKIKQLQSQE